MQSLKSSLYYPVCLPICGMFYFEKHSGKMLFWELLTVSFLKCTPGVSSGIIKEEFVLCLLIHFLFRCLNFWPLQLPAKPGGAVLKLKLLKSCCTLSAAKGTQISSCSWNIHTTDHGCYGQGYGWALIPPSHWRSFWQPQRRPATKGLKLSAWSKNARLQSEVFVFTEWTCVFLLFPRRLVPTAGKTSTTTPSISFHMDTAPSFLPLSRAGRSRSSPVMKVWLRHHGGTNFVFIFLLLNPYELLT